MAQRILISVTSDMVTDQRVNRMASTLKEAGHRVLVIARSLKTSAELMPKRYRIIRFKLWFEKGPLFYLTFNIRLFGFLMWHHADILVANDLDTLLPNYLASRLKRIPLVYDSHEYFTGVPELEGRPRVKKIWKLIEKLCVPGLKHAITVNQSIANLYDNEYGTAFQVIKNVPEVSLPFMADKNELRVRLNLPSDRKIVILQGAGINIQRGAEEAVESMNYLNGVLLLIIGGGDVIDQLKQQVVESRLTEKVMFVAKQPVLSLRKYTAACDLGITLDKDTNINYKFSLPNKLFDYIQAGIPILASNLPEVRNVIETYQVGRISEDHNPENIAKHINEMLNDADANAIWRVNLEKASKELNWEKEREKFLRIFNAID